MRYRAHLNFDFDDTDVAQYQKLIAALLQIGWTYVQTSALVIESDELPIIWTAIELVAK